MMELPRTKRRGRSKQTAPSLEPVDSAAEESVEKQVYRRIRHGLMTGLIAPESMLTGRSLAEQLQVSVQPVRDALKRLEADGILEGRSKSGFYLRPMTGEKYWEITEIRVRLEGLAGKRAAGKVDSATIRKLHEINSRMAGDTAEGFYLKQNFDFHFLIYSRSEMPALLAIIENLWARIGPILNYHPHDFNHQETLRKHNVIIEALERHDGEATEKAIAHDLVTAAELIVESLD